MRARDPAKPDQPPPTEARFEERDANVDRSDLNPATPAAGAIAPGVLLRQWQEWTDRLLDPADQAARRGIVAADPLTVALVAEACAVAAASVNVLITGPSGSGKDLLAQHIHAQSPRAGGPFIAVNCAALPDAMLESLMFGHERGAFTGAVTASTGLMRAADGGTLFLDEIGELPLALQAKLLRALQDRAVLPLGATRPVNVDIRLVAATNRNLAADAAHGRFREDLLWRIAVFELAAMPLAARPADIVPLTAALMHRHAADAAPGPVTGRRAITAAALAMLVAHDWPGNVRQLDNVLQRAAILAGGGPITPAHLRLGAAPSPVLHSGAGAPDLSQALRTREAEAIGRALADSAGRRAAAAERLGISERTLRYKMAALAGRPRANVAGRPGANVAGRPGADVTVRPGADVVGRPGADVAGRPGADGAGARALAGGAVLQ